MARIVAGVMGPGETATAGDCSYADRLGELIAAEGWVLLTGGRRFGVMDAALRGAKRGGGLTIGILPNDDTSLASDSVDIRIVTGLGEARNIVNVLSSDVLFVCGMSTGTASETALALRAGRDVVLLNAGREALEFWQSLDGRLHPVASADEAIEVARRVLASRASQV